MSPGVNGDLNRVEGEIISNLQGSVAGQPSKSKLS